MSEPTRAFFTVPEAAELLRVGRTAAYAAVRTGQLPSVRVGRHIRIPRHALVARENDTAGVTGGRPATDQEGGPHDG